MPPSTVLYASLFSLAQGRPVDRLVPVVPAPCIFYARGPWVRQSPGLPCALCFSMRVVEWKNSDRSCRENADAHPPPVTPRAGGASSMPRPLGSSTTASGILGRPTKSGDDSGERRALYQTLMV